MLDDQTRFQATDELALLNAISQSEVTAKKLELYSGLASHDEVKKFFKVRVALMKKTSDDLRKLLDKIANS